MGTDCVSWLAEKVYVQVAIVSAVLRVLPVKVMRCGVYVAVKLRVAY